MYLTDIVLESRYSIASQDKPKLERAEPSAQDELPVAVVDDGSCIAFFRAKVQGGDVQRVCEKLAVSDPQA